MIHQLKKFGLILLCATALPITATAQTVTLRSSDGALDITGRLLGFEDNNYLIETGLGELRISANTINCEGEACPRLEPEGVSAENASLSIGGSDTVGLGLLPLLIEGYAGAMSATAEVSPTGVTNEIFASFIGDEGFGSELTSMVVNSTVSGEGFDKLRDNVIDISMASRRIRPAEARELTDTGAGNMISPDQEHIVAADSLVMIVHPDNPITSLTLEQVRQIYTGQIRNWSQLGGRDLQITPLSLPEGSGTRSVFLGRVFGDSDQQISDVVRIVPTNPDASQFVTENEGAFSYVSYAFRRDANKLSLINSCGIAMTPDAFSAKTEEYALQRRLYMYTRADNRPDAVDSFIRYATSVAADNVITKSGFIGFAVERRPQDMTGSRARMLLAPTTDTYAAGFMRDMLAEMVDYDRLSTTFRFNTGSADLDGRGRIDMDRLITYLETQDPDAEILFVGFTDDVGQFDGNLDLSRRRAEQVANQFRIIAGDRLPDVTVQSRGFGEVAPAGCNTDEVGRRINRRTEVWIKTGLQ